MSEELNLCQCGKKVEWFTGDFGAHFIVCNSCDFCFSSNDLKKEVTIKKWNTLTSSDEIKQLRKELEEAKDIIESAVDGIKWYQSERPELSSGADDEFLSKAESFIKSRGYENANT